jgi:hypothetical protein
MWNRERRPTEPRCAVWFEPAALREEGFERLAGMAEDVTMTDNERSTFVLRRDMVGRDAP